MAKLLSDLLTQYPGLASCVTAIGAVLVVCIPLGLIAMWVALTLWVCKRLGLNL